MRTTLVGLAAGFLVAFMAMIMAFLWGAIMAIPVMLLWDYTVPFLVPGAKELDYWHALTLYVLCNLLFKSGSSSNSKSSD
jgi:hypothetical protein